MISYVIQVTVVWGVLYGFYHLVLRNLTFFTLNRVYLLVSLMIGIVGPTIDLQGTKLYPSAESKRQYWSLPTFSTQWVPIDQTTLRVKRWLSVDKEPLQSSRSNQEPWYLYVYIFGVCLATIRFMGGLWQIVVIYRQGKKYYANDHIRIEHQAVGSPFSFFHCIFWSPALDLRSKEGQRILQHEKAHSELSHSYDRMLLEVLQILCWFHPIIWLYKGALQQIHEYQADAVVLRETAVRTYGTMLIRQAQKTGHPAFLAHSFSKSQLKNRIFMMTRKKSTHKALWRYFLVIPISFLMLIGFANPGVSQTSAKTAMELLKQQGEDVFISVEKMPVFSDDECTTLTGEAYQMCTAQKVMEYVSRQIRYPKEAKKQGLEGKVLVEFVITKDGSVFQPTIVQEIGGGTGEEVVRVLSKMPKWQPGILNGEAVHTRMMLPVVFELPPKEVEQVEPSIIIEELPYTKEGMPKSQDTNQKEVYQVVDQMPLFPGTSTLEESNQAIMKFVLSQIKYPKLARKNEVEGTNLVRFVVQKDGTVGDVQILKDIGSGTGEESLRIVNSLPAGWSPGILDQRAVHVQFVLPIAFKLDDSVSKISLGEYSNEEQEVIIEEEAIAKNLTQEDTFLVVEKMPLFGDATTSQESNIAVFKYLAKHIEYPKLARKNGIEGLTVIEFVVTKNGTITDVKILRDLGYGTGEEGLRVIQNMPSWQPGQQRGKQVNVVM
ncbi:MAG: M56 family metallopeptidase, partial [Saprospiraceae bacterium]|nr:M56 family metallopeptidase [Saprospiraceae bacterium]